LGDRFCPYLRFYGGEVDWLGIGVHCFVLCVCMWLVPRGFVSDGFGNTLSLVDHHQTIYT
jgi:hypothetical protein